MVYDDVCTDYLHSLKYERCLSKRTIASYSSWLSLYRQWLDAEGIGPELDARFCLPVLRRYLYSLTGRKLRPRTVRNAFAPLRSLGDFCVENGVLTDNPTRLLKMPKKDAAQRLIVSTEELKALLAATERQADEVKVARERAMLCVLIFCGIRFQEWIDLKVGDVNLDNRTLLVASGKGSKSRLLYPPAECLSALSEWMTIRARMKPKHDWLWAYDIGRRMGELGTRQMLAETKARAGLADRNNIHPHAIRRAFATRLLSRADLKSTQAALGHANGTTTLLYCFDSERPAQAMQQLAGLDENTGRDAAAAQQRQASHKARRRMMRSERRTA